MREDDRVEGRKMLCGNVCCRKSRIMNRIALLWLCSPVPFVCLSVVSVMGDLYTYRNVLCDKGLAVPHRILCIIIPVVRNEKNNLLDFFD